MECCNVGNSKSMNLLGNVYYNKIKDYDQAVKYYTMGMEYNNSFAIRNLASYYYYIKKDYPLAKKYYEIAVDYKNNVAMHDLAEYYELIEEDEEMALYYYQLALTNGNVLSLQKICNKYKNNLKLYKFLLNFKESVDFVKNKIIELEKHKDIIIYKNKISLFKKLNNYGLCSICLDNNVLNIDLSCGHEICSDCYEPNMQCYYSWCEC